jgi:hypothetical protein
MIRHTTNPMKTGEHCQEGEEIARPTDKNRGAERATTDDQPTMNTTSWPTQASVASWASLEGESRSFWATARTWLLELFTSALTRDVEPRCQPSVAFTPSGPLVYQWQIHRSTAQDGVPLRPESKRRDIGAESTAPTGLRADLSQLDLDEEEAKAWELSPFPHLLLPDLVEAHIVKLNLQSADTKHGDVLVSDISPKSKPVSLLTP